MEKHNTKDTKATRRTRSAANKAPRLRLDRLLVERGLVPSRERAQALIMAGRVLVGGQKQEKPGSAVATDAAVEILGADLRYVSRGGLKLEKALEHWRIDVRGRVCMDVGASTGGFTDCLLQHGAAQVVAVDTGYGQMDARLRRDARVRLLEKTNARYLRGEDVAAAVEFVAVDVSFISATLVVPAVVRSIQQAAGRLVPEARAEDWPRKIVVLVKPQFEAGREQVGKGGIVRDPAAQQAAVEKVRGAVEALQFASIEVIESPITGAEGNREWLVYGKR